MLFQLPFLVLEHGKIQFANNIEASDVQIVDLVHTKPPNSWPNSQILFEVSYRFLRPSFQLVQASNVSSTMTSPKTLQYKLLLGC